MEMVKKIITNDKVERALKTFFEAFFSYLAININSFDTIKGLLMGAIASAISVLINTIKTYKKECEEAIEEIEDSFREED